MRISDILPYIDLEKMKVKTFIEIINRLHRQTPKQQHSDDGAKARQYGDELHNLSVKQARLEAARTIAEINRLMAQAARDRIAASLVASSASGVPRSTLEDRLV